MDSCLGRAVFGLRPEIREGKPVCWAPAMNVEETDVELRLEVELPGVPREAIQLTVTGDTLQVAGEKYREGPGPKRNYFIMERVFGPFRRCVQLPSFVDPDRVKAEFSSGMLTVVLPKVSEKGSRMIKVEEG